jgi:hypothetical protein
MGWSGIKELIISVRALFFNKSKRDYANMRNRELKNKDVRLKNENIAFVVQ